MYVPDSSIIISDLEKALLELGLAGTGVEVRLPPKEPEERLEEVVDTLVLLGEVQVERVEASVVGGRHRRPRSCCYCCCCGLGCLGAERERQRDREGLVCRKKRV